MSPRRGRAEAGARGEDGSGSEPSMAELRRRLRATSRAFLRRHGDEIQTWRGEIAAAIEDAVGRLRAEMVEATAGDARISALAERIDDYVRWLQWALWDLPDFAVVARPDPARFRQRVAACGLTYLALRLLDDLVDRHYVYRGEHATLLATLLPTTDPPNPGVLPDGDSGNDLAGGPSSAAELRRQEASSLGAALLLVGRGLGDMADLVAEDGAVDLLRATTEAFRRTVLGGIFEQRPEEQWDLETYERMIGLKNVAYQQGLWASLDPAGRSPLLPFLQGYWSLAQKINDVQDQAADEARGQANLVALLRRADPDADVGPRLAALLAHEIRTLAHLTEDLPAAAKRVARHKLAETLDATFERGVFQTRAARPRQRQPTPPLDTALRWTSSQLEACDRHGADAVEETCCAVCGSVRRQFLFRKHDFAYRRCLDCAHVYVAPRLREDLRSAIATRHVHDDPFLDVQRIYAAYVVSMLRQRSGGGRLLDIGFGHGFLLHTARGAGFEVYGLETSDQRVDQAHANFGDRVRQMHIGEQPLPWGAFDVIVLSHVLEHVAEPATALRRISEALRPGGWLYVAVPDLESLQFQVFGKRWEVVSPIAHLHYFSAAPLEKLLTEAGFESVEALAAPAFRPSRAPAWMRLFRQRGGTESGELAMVARRPDDPEVTP